MEQMAVANGVWKEEENENKIHKILSAFLIILGLLLSAYLFHRYHTLTSDNHDRIDVCSAVFGKGCDNALTSSVSNQLGLPLAGWGIIYFVTLATLLFLPNLFGEVFRKPIKPAVFALSLFACATAVSFIILMLVKPALFCPLCTIIHAINMINFIIVWKQANYSFQHSFTKLKTWSVHVKTTIQNDPAFKLKLMGFLTVLSVAVALYLGLQIAQNQPAQADASFNYEENLKEFKMQERKHIQVDGDDPIQGPIDSPIEIIVFSDFECPSCRYFSLVLKELEKEYTGKFHVVYKYFPLGKACNSFIDKNVHPRACEAAMAAEAANQQNKFWEYHDSLFATNLNQPDKTVCSIAKSLGLDNDKFEKSRTGQATIMKIKRSTELANSLGINGTPTVFLNGRFVKNFSLLSMKSLIDDDLASKHGDRGY